MAFVVTNRCRDTFEAQFSLFVVEGDVVATHLVQFFFKCQQGGQRMRGFTRQAGTLGVVPDFLRTFSGQKEFAE